MRRVLVFGLLGPAASYLSFCFLTGWHARWGDLPLAYGIEVIPFLLCALIDFWLDEAPLWERFVVAGIAGFLGSAVAVSVAAITLFHGNIAFAVLGFCAAIPAAVCSLLSAVTDFGDAAPINDGAACGVDIIDG